MHLMTGLFFFMFKNDRFSFSIIDFTLNYFSYFLKKPNFNQGFLAIFHQDFYPLLNFHNFYQFNLVISLTINLNF